MIFKTSHLSWPFRWERLRHWWERLPPELIRALGMEMGNLWNDWTTGKVLPPIQLVSFFFFAGGEGNQKTSWVFFFSGFLFFVFLCKKTSLYLILARFPIFWKPLQPVFFVSWEYRWCLFEFTWSWSTLHGWHFIGNPDSLFAFPRNRLASDIEKIPNVTRSVEAIEAIEWCYFRVGLGSDPVIIWSYNFYMGWKKPQWNPFIKPFIGVKLPLFMIGRSPVNQNYVFLHDSGTTLQHIAVTEELWLFFDQTIFASQIGVLWNDYP